MSRHEWRALAAFFILGWRQAATQRATTFGRVLLLVLILYIFWAMWKATPLGELGQGHVTVEQLFWYLAATETVAMSVGFPYRTVESDILSGEMASSLARPIPYALANFANWIGETSHRFIVIVVAAVACGIWTTQTLPCDLLTGMLLLAGLWIGCVMVLLSQLAIGLLATWTHSAAPVFWIWQKLFFVLGGLIIPLSLYPSWLSTIAKATPFAAMLFLPASLVLAPTASQIPALLAMQLLWLLALAALAVFIYRRAELRLIRLGG